MTKLEQPSDVLFTHFVSATYIASYAPQIMPDGGNIIFFGSSSGLRGRADTPPMYSASKAALINYAEHLAEKMAPDIRVNLINPCRVLSQLRIREGASLEGCISADFVAQVTSRYVATKETGRIVNLRYGMDNANSNKE